MTTTRELADELDAHHQRRAGRGMPPRTRWRSVAVEALLIAVAGLLYSLVRGLTDDRVDEAYANAEQVISLERRLGMFVEPDLQHWAVGSDVAVNLLNAIYIAYWPIVIGTLLWLLIRRPAAYPLYRTALLTSGLLSLAVFALYPLAPPRFLPEYGFVDTIAAHSDSYREFTTSALVNEYAAMPSLHFGWVLLASIAIAALMQHRLARVAAVTLPLLMLAAIVLTGNHFFLDAIVGAAVVLAGLWIALVITQTVRTGNASAVASVRVP